MKTLAIATGLLAFTVYAAGCSRSEEPAAPEAAPSEMAAEPVAEPATTPDVEAGPTSYPTANNGHDYLCEDVKLNAKVTGGTLVVTVDGQAKTLTPTAGATGASYSGEGISFIAQGNQAMLLRDGEKPRNCSSP